jgi:hypothetical protein
MAVVVDAVNASVSRYWPHVSQERLKAVSPPLADSYPASAPVLKFLVTRIQASGFHVAPYPVLARLAARGVAVLPVEAGDPFADQATATARSIVAFSETATAHDCLFAAITTAMPMHAVVSTMRSAEDKKTAETKPGQINQYGHVSAHYSRYSAVNPLCNAVL